MLPLKYLKIPRFPKVVLTTLSLVVSAAIGSVAWHGELIGLLFAPLIVVLWGRACSRAGAFLIMLGYYLATGYGLVEGAGVFFGEASILPNPLPGLFLWFGYASILASGWASAWGPKAKAARLVIALFIVSAPPIGTLGGFNPVLSAGLYFPGLGWVGLGLTVCWFCVLAHAPANLTTRLTTSLPFLLVAIISNLVYSTPVLPNWFSLDTSLGPATSSDAQYDRMLTLQDKVSAWSSDHGQGSVLLLPELVGDNWAVNEDWWRDIDRRLKHRQQTLLLGAFIPVGTGRAYENVILAIGENAGIKFKDRVPVPISMWKPWTDDGAISFWFDPGINQIKEHRVASLICYEQLLVWPALLSFAKSPDVLIAPANDWWATKTNLPELQQQSVFAWARLFSVPYIWATNR